MEHTYLAKKFANKIPEHDKEACMETLDNFVLKYVPNDNANSLMELPSDLFQVFLLLVKIYKVPNKKIKEGITIDKIIGTFSQHFEKFKEIHQDSDTIIFSDDLNYFMKNVVNYFLEDV